MKFKVFPFDHTQGRFFVFRISYFAFRASDFLSLKVLIVEELKSA
jgi:hypothetical protein